MDQGNCGNSFWRFHPYFFVEVIANASRGCKDEIFDFFFGIWRGIKEKSQFPFSLRISFTFLSSAPRGSDPCMRDLKHELPNQLSDQRLISEPPPIIQPSPSWRLFSPFLKAFKVVVPPLVGLLKVLKYFVF